MPVETKYYEILNIAVDASEADIKKAYRKGSLQWHPDRNLDRKEEAEQRFKLLAEAYEVLSDAKKRAIYDRYGEQGLKAGGNRSVRKFKRSGFFNDFQFHSPEEVFDSFFKGKTFSNFVGGILDHDPFFADMMDGFEQINCDFLGDDFFDFRIRDPSPSFSPFHRRSFTGCNNRASTFKSTYIVNGKKSTVSRTIDAKGNVTTATIFPNGQRQRKINGIVQNKRDPPKKSIRID